MIHSSKNLALRNRIPPLQINVNSGNKNKLLEYKDYLDQFGHQLSNTNFDLKEPDSDHETIICYKASQFDDGTLVDDVSLIIEGFDIGVNVRWFLEKNALNDEKYWYQKSSFICYLGVNINEQVYLYQGRVDGTIVQPKGKGFGIGPHFLPQGATQTLGQKMIPELNPRYLALTNYLNNKWHTKRRVMKTWLGEFQE